MKEVVDLQQGVSPQPATIFLSILLLNGSAFDNLNFDVSLANGEISSSQINAKHGHAAAMNQNCL